MRLLKWSGRNQISLTRDFHDDERPPYAILSHTWAVNNDEEVTLKEVETARGRKKPGYQKILFCAERARRDGINHFWVDTCCIDKTNHVELSEAITSMFRWYRDAVKCYVYLSDVSACKRTHEGDTQSALWDSSFRNSRWFTRGWTLQELLAPKSIEFFSRERSLLGNKITLAQQIHEITTIPITALGETHFTEFSTTERMRWAEKRQTKKPEDQAYCLLGIFDISMALIYGEGDKAFHRLLKEIKEESRTTTSSISVYWLVPRAANTLFTGRHDLLRELADIVRAAVHSPWDRALCRIVISGIGGQGKSEICLQLARRLRSLFWAVMWIDISTTDMAERAFLAAARQLSIPAQDWEDARNGIASLQQPWLLVLDNADDPEVDYQNYFPEGRYGVVIMTTRNNECQQYGTDKTIALQGLAIDEARDLLLKAARIHADQQQRYTEDATVVAGLLQSHPLALIQAGAYVSRGHCTLADYPLVYEKQRRRLLAYRPAQARSRYCDVYATFEVSAKKLAAMGTQAAQDALQLLPLLAVGGASQFPLSIFEAGWQGARRVAPDLDDEAEDDEVKLLTLWHVAHIPSLCKADTETWDVYRMTEAVACLEAFSLISTYSQDNFVFVSLHPLVHAWARDRQDQQQQRQTWLQMGCLVALAVRYKVLTPDQKRRLQSHIEALVGWSIHDVFSTGPAVSVARIIVNCGWYLYEQRADAKLSTLLHETFTALGLDSLKVEQRWTGLYDLAGRNLRRNGKIRDALTMLEEVLKIRKQTLAEDDARRLGSQHALARVYRGNGQIREALALFEEVVKVSRKTLAKDHPDRLATQHELAKVYRDNGQIRTAAMLLVEVVEIQKRTLAEDHRDRLASEHELARAYLANGQVREAVTLLEAVVKIQKRTMTEGHPLRLASQHELARAYKDNGQISEAVILLEEVVRIQKQTLAEDHPYRLKSEHTLATYLWDTGEQKAAYNLMAHVVGIRKRVLDDHHPDRLGSEYTLATYLWDTGEREAAHSLMVQVVETQQRVLDKHHPNRQASEDWLGHMTREMAAS